MRRLEQIRNTMLNSLKIKKRFYWDSEMGVNLESCGFIIDGDYTFNDDGSISLPYGSKITIPIEYANEAIVAVNLIETTQYLGGDAGIYVGNGNEYSGISLSFWGTWYPYSFTNPKVILKQVRSNSYGDRKVEFSAGNKSNFYTNDVLEGSENNSNGSYRIQIKGTNYLQIKKIDIEVK